MSGRPAHRRPGLRHRLLVGLDRVRNALFWAGYRVLEVSPWTRMAHRDSERHEVRIEQLEADVRRLSKLLASCTECVTELAQLTIEAGE